MRRLLLIPFLVAGLTVGSPSHASPAVAPTRILYSSDWSGPRQIYAVSSDREAAVAQLTFGPAPACSRRPGVSCGFYAPEPSPDGRELLFWDSHYEARESTLYVARSDGSRRRAVARNVPRPSRDSFPKASWSPDSRKIAFLNGAWHIVRADGTGDRVVGSTPSWVHESGTSPDGRWVATTNAAAVQVSNASHTSVRTFPFAGGPGAAWAPDSRSLAISTADGIRVLDVRTGRSRRLTVRTGSELAWSPDALAIAFVDAAADDSPDTGDLRVVSLTGRLRTVVDAASAHGGYISGIVWTRPPSAVRYRRPTRRFPVSPDHVVLPWSVERLAADGDRVAFSACGHVFVWSPKLGTVQQAEPVASLSPRCSTPTDYEPIWIYSLALAGDRVAWGELVGNMGRTAWLGGASLRSRQPFTLGKAYGAGGPFTWKGLGELAGAGGVLAFSTWEEAYRGGTCCTIVTAEQSVRRAEPGGCPCPALRTDPGPLVPFDVDDGRIAAGGENATLLLDGNGAQLLSVRVRASAAALSGADLVVLEQGRLLHFDTASAALLHTWPLPDVSSGRQCGSLNLSRCYPPPRLLLEDAARGLVAYVLDGQVHLLRLADGADGVVAPGTLARFMDEGLVYADGPRFHLVPFGKLPLR